jgi:hypothetical protein
MKSKRCKMCARVRKQMKKENAYICYCCKKDVNHYFALYGTKVYGSKREVPQGPLLAGWACDDHLLALWQDHLNWSDSRLVLEMDGVHANLVALIKRMAELAEQNKLRQARIAEEYKLQTALLQ